MTVFSYLALALSSLSSAGLSTLGSIVASASWVVGSIIVPGNVFLLPDSNTTTTSKVFVGAQETLNITASGLNFVTNGSQSGVTLKDNGTVRYASHTVTCTATGGLAKYDTCISPQFSKFGIGSGVLVAEMSSLEIGNSPISVGIDCGVVKATSTASGSSLVNNYQTATGSIVRFTTGATVVVNGADYIKCGSLTNPTSPFTARLKFVFWDLFGE